MPVGGQLCGLIGYGNGYGNGYGAGYLIPSTIAISADDYKRLIKAICARAFGLVGYYCAYHLSERSIKVNRARAVGLIVL